MRLHGNPTAWYLFLATERTHAAVQASLGRVNGDFSSRLYLPFATCLNLVNDDFVVLAFSFRAVRVGDVLYLVVTQIFLLLMVWAQQR